jgi:branched-chain amino acid transport system substrate-binding protein
MRTPTDRRSFLGGASALIAAAAVTGFPSLVKAAKETTVLGLFPFTGPYADTGPLMSKAAELALKEINYEVGGHKLRYVTRDSETKAGAATRRAEEAIASDNVTYIVGPWSSGVALAVSEVAHKHKVLYWFSGGTEDIAGKRCHRYAFQWAANAWTAMDAVLSTFHKANPKAKRLYLFIVDYAFGWSLQKYVENLAPTYGFDVVGVDRHPLGQREYSSYITKASAANPDAIYMVNFGLDTVSAVRQLNNFGLTPKIPVILSWSAGVEELVQMTPEMRQNMFVGTNFYYTIDTPVAKKFVAAYRAQDPNHRPPGYAPGAAYGLMRMVLAGIRKAGSPDVAAVVKATEGLKIDDLVGEEYVVPRNHQTLRPYFVLKTKPKSEMQNEYDFGTIIDTSAKEQPRELNECKDIGSL